MDEVFELCLIKQKKLEKLELVEFFTPFFYVATVANPNTQIISKGGKYKKKYIGDGKAFVPFSHLSPHLQMCFCTSPSKLILFKGD